MPRSRKRKKPAPRKPPAGSPVARAAREERERAVARFGIDPEVARELQLAAREEEARGVAEEVVGLLEDDDEPRARRALRRLLVIPGLDAPAFLAQELAEELIEPLDGEDGDIPPETWVDRVLDLHRQVHPGPLADELAAAVRRVLEEFDLGPAAERLAAVVPDDLPSSPLERAEDREEAMLGVLEMTEAVRRRWAAIRRAAELRTRFDDDEDDLDVEDLDLDLETQEELLDLEAGEPDPALAEAVDLLRGALAALDEDGADVDGLVDRALAVAGERERTVPARLALEVLATDAITEGTPWPTLERVDRAAATGARLGERAAAVWLTAIEDLLGEEELGEGVLERLYELSRDDPFAPPEPVLEDLDPAAARDVALAVLRSIRDYRRG